MAIDRTGISTGEEVRRLIDELENALMLNFRSYFAEKRDVPLDRIDVNDWKRSKFEKLTEFENSNRRLIQRYARHIENVILADLRASYDFGIDYVERIIKRAEKQGIEFVRTKKVLAFAKNPRVAHKIEELKDLLNMSFNTAIRHLNSQYIQVVRTVDQYGRPTLLSALDAATQQFKQTGVVAQITANNRLIKMSNYIELNTIEFSQEMLFLGEGAKAEEVEIYTVYVSKHESSCPLCKPWEGQILIDDVYRGGKPDGKHQLLSVAIKQGLGHPNCRHHWVPYLEGVDVIPEEELKRKMPKDTKLYEAEQELRYIERNIRHWKTREAMAFTPQEQMKASVKVREWQARARKLVKSTEGLHRQYWREKPGFKMPEDTRWRDLKYNKKVFGDKLS